MRDGAGKMEPLDEEWYKLCERREEKPMKMGRESTNLLGRQRCRRVGDLSCGHSLVDVPPPSTGAVRVDY